MVQYFCYLRFLAAIFNAQIVRWTWFCPQTACTNWNYYSLSQNKFFALAYFQNKLPFSEVESRTQGSRPRTRTQKKKSEAKDSLSEDRHSRGQGQKCSRPKTKDTSASALQKKGLHKNFSGELKKKGKKKDLHRYFSSDLHKKTFSKKFFKRSTKF